MLKKEDLVNLGYFGRTEPDYPQWAWGKTFTYLGESMSVEVANIRFHPLGQGRVRRSHASVEAWQDEEEGNKLRSPIGMRNPQVGDSFQVPSLEEFQEEIIKSLLEKHGCSSVDELLTLSYSKEMEYEKRVQEDRLKCLQEKQERDIRMSILAQTVEGLNQKVAPHGYVIRYDISSIWVKTQKVGYDFKESIDTPEKFEKGVEALKNWVDSLPKLLPSGKVPPKKKK